MSPRHETFFGREAELSQALALLDEVRGGRARTLLLGGEPGIGKTRLALEVARVAVERGFRHALGRCYADAGAPVYWPFDEALESLRRQAPDLAFERLTADGASRFHLLQATNAGLRAAAAVAPVVLTVDDLHWADPGTIGLFEFLAGHLGDAAVLLVGTFRDFEASRSPELAFALSRASREGLLLMLGGLPEAAVSALVRAAGGREADAADIFRRTLGNPLFADQLARASGTQALPFGLGEALRRRVDLVGPEARSLMEALAVVERPLPAATLASLADVPHDRALDLLAACAEAGLLRADEAGPYGLFHPLLRDAVLAGLPPSRRLRLHARAAEVLADTPSAAAHHLLLAGPEAAARAIPLIARAAEEAIVRFEPGVAIALLDRAETVLRPATAEPRLRAEWLLAAGRARARAGEVEAGRAQCRAAAESARQVGDPALLASVGLAMGAELIEANVDAALIGLLEDALAGLPEEALSLRARVMGRLASARQPAPDPGGPMALAWEAITLARGIEPPDERLEALHAAMGALTDYADPAERRPVNAECVALARQLGDPPRLLRSLARLMMDDVESGDFGAARARLGELERASVRAGIRRWRDRLPRLRAMLASLDAEWETVAGLLEEAPPGSPTFEIQPWVLAETFERPDDVQAGLRALAAAGVDLADLGGVADAQRLLRAAREGAPCESLWARIDPSHPMWRWELPSTASVAEAAALCGRADIGAAVEPLLLDHAHRWLCGGLTAMYLGPPIVQYVGYARAAQGRREEARAAFDEAERRLRAAGARALLAQVRLAQGMFCLDGAARDAALDEARTLALACGMPGLLTRWQRLGPPAPLPSPAALDPAAPPFALEMSGDVWKLRCPEGEPCFKDSRGFRVLATLLAEPGREVHALDLVAEPGAADAGDAGEVLDAQARAAYKARLLELREVIEEAESVGHASRAERARAELEALAEQLAAATGLGGRARRTGSAAERARVAVQRRVRDAIRRITEASPSVGRHLDWAVHTGTFCVYTPRGR